MIKKSSYFTLLVCFIGLTLTGCGGSSSSDETPTPEPETPPAANVAPTANAGSEQTVDEISSVTLDGSASSDSDGSISTFSWTQTAGMSVTLDDASSATTSFSAPEVDSTETLTFELTVTDDDGDTATATVTITINNIDTQGVLLDRQVINVAYQTETNSGFTDENGAYPFKPGETVTFSIGALSFATVPASGVVTPLDLAGKVDATDPEVVNILRLLQTLDQDGNAENGITITQSAIDNAVQLDFEQSVDDFENSASVQTLITNGGQDNVVTELVSQAQAVEHFTTTLEDEGVSFTTFAGVYETQDKAATFHFLADNSYVAIQSVDAEAGWVGYEMGTYTVAEGVLTITAEYNHDGESLTCSAPRGQICSEPFTTNYDVTDSGMNWSSSSEDTTTLNRIAFTPNSIEGTWLFLDDEQFSIWTFKPDGTYVEMERYYNQPEFNWYMHGDYVLEGSSLSVNIVGFHEGLSDTCTGTSESPCEQTFEAFTNVTIEENQLSLFVAEEQSTSVLTRLF